jgi:hypothetical protein
MMVWSVAILIFKVKAKTKKTKVLQNQRTSFHETVDNESMTFHHEKGFQFNRKESLTKKSQSMLAYDRLLQIFSLLVLTLANGIWIMHFLLRMSMSYHYYMQDNLSNGLVFPKIILWIPMLEIVFFGLPMFKRFSRNTKPVFFFSMFFLWINLALAYISFVDFEEWNRHHKSTYRALERINHLSRLPQDAVQESAQGHLYDEKDYGVTHAFLNHYHDFVLHTKEVYHSFDAINQELYQASLQKIASDQSTFEDTLSKLSEYSDMCSIERVRMVQSIKQNQNHLKGLEQSRYIKNLSDAIDSYFQETQHLFFEYTQIQLDFFECSKDYFTFLHRHDGINFSYIHDQMFFYEDVYFKEYLLKLKQFESFKDKLDSLKSKYDLASLPHEP